MSAIILQDEIVHYEVLGRGRPVIFLHGWVGSWRYWIPNMQAASISFRTYALDLWGFGDTAKTNGNYSIHKQVDLLDQFLQEMGIGKIALVGHGLGAIVGMIFATRKPRFVDRILTVSLPGSLQMLNPRLYAAAPEELADWLLGHTPVGAAARVEAPKADQKAIQLSLSDLAGFELERLPFNTATPCLLVYGQNDPVVQTPTFEMLSQLPEHTHQIIFEQSGHFPMIDEASKFNRLMADFLALSSGESPHQLQLKDEWKRRVR